MRAGFILPLDGTTQESKLRFIHNFKWTDTLQGNIGSAQQDAVFELVSMAFNVAIWYTKFASRLSGKENVTEDEAKDVHRSLKIAAGTFKTLKESHIPRLITPAEKGRDLEARVIDTYIIQSQAEAQEVTIARAIELKHNAALIAALAYETANFYQKADHTLNTLDPECSAKWRKYLQLKQDFYMAYAHCYHGQTLLAADKCGEAIRSLQEAEKCTQHFTSCFVRYYCADYSRAEALCKEYRQTKGPGSTAKPSEQLFFLKLGSLIKNTLEKCQRENGFIYFHKVPAEAPALELKASYGLAEPTPFELPALNAQCTPEVYATFDLTKGPKDDKQRERQKFCVNEGIEIIFMNQTSGDQELSDYDVKAQKKKVLYFSSGEILTESEEEEDEDELHQTFWVSQGNWSLKERSRFWGTHVLKMSLRICDFFGEKMASLLGLNSAKYQYAIDQHHRLHQNKTGGEIVSTSTGQKVERLHVSQTVSYTYGSTNDFKDQKRLKETLSERETNE
ncbi:BRO1 domain-containing protein BROX [Triplophysa tibetana]|uniref:BRO1 domain-containing protein BROX n=1 Tax=Triplophysa tibetana TaxID=1572043 RepID=A0A5A9NEX6_9TELE|nr:BRO1 domain-containing protein BROX [Triplophysa tibetana]